eukprot:Gb_41215 [translate_table: standard]
MAVYYKFKSAKDYDSVAIEGHFISVGNLKETIFESKNLGRGTDFDLVISNAQTNEEYLDDGTLVPKNTSVVVRRVPGRPGMPIVTERQDSKVIEIPKDEVLQPETDFQFTNSSHQIKSPDDSEWDEFGNDLYSLPEEFQVQKIHTQQALINKVDEDNKIRAFVDSSASEWQRQTQECYSAGRDFGRGAGGRGGMAGRGYGRVMDRSTPPQGYVCHRCGVPGHFIQHCPTNGDPAYDIKRMKPPTGIPKSMLVAAAGGSYALPSGAVAILRPNESAFDKEVEGLPSINRSVGEVPPELRCPFCKDVMKDAVLTSKCCFKSYCDKCIRDHIMLKGICICGATNICADDLLPNKTLRDTIARILETTTSSAENAGSWLEVQDMESARCPMPKRPLSSLSAFAKEAHTAPLKSNMSNANEDIIEGKQPVCQLQQTADKNSSVQIAGKFEVAHESMRTKEPVTWENEPQNLELQPQMVAGERAKKKKKRVRQPSSSNELQWRASQDFGAQSCAMPYAPAAYNAYRPGAQWGLDGYMASYGGDVPSMAYGYGQCDMPSGGAMMVQDQFGMQGYMPAVAPFQRDRTMGTHKSAPLVMSREEFEARKAEVRRKREQQQLLSSREHGKDLGTINGDIPSGRPQVRVSLRASSPATDDMGMTMASQHRFGQSQSSPGAGRERKPNSRDGLEPWDDAYPSDSKLGQPINEAETANSSKLVISGRLDRKQKGSVFSRISFPEFEDIDDVQIPAVKKSKLSSHVSRQGAEKHDCVEIDSSDTFNEHDSTDHENIVRVGNGSKVNYGDLKPVKNIVNGRRPYDEINDAQFKPKYSSFTCQVSDETDT